MSRRSEIARVGRETSKKVRMRGRPSRKSNLPFAHRRWIGAFDRRDSKGEIGKALRKRKKRVRGSGEELGENRPNQNDEGANCWGFGKYLGIESNLSDEAMANLLGEKNSPVGSLGDGAQKVQ